MCVISQLANAPFSVLSVTSSEASKALRDGKGEGALVTAEVPVAAIAQGEVDCNAMAMRIPLRAQPTNANDVMELLAK